MVLSCLPIDNHSPGSKEQEGKEDPPMNCIPLLEKQKLLLIYHCPELSHLGSFGCKEIRKNLPCWRYFTWCIKNIQIMSCWMRRHKPPTQGWQVAPSVSELLPWGGENPRAVLIEGTVSIHSHKGSEITKWITYQSRKWGWGGRGTMSWGKGSPPSQVTSEQEIQSRVARTYYLWGWLGLCSLAFPGLNSKQLF